MHDLLTISVFARRVGLTVLEAGGHVGDARPPRRLIEPRRFIANGNRCCSAGTVRMDLPLVEKEVGMGRLRAILGS